jgi:hypothetical protein
MHLFLDQCFTPTTSSQVPPQMHFFSYKTNWVKAHNNDRFWGGVTLYYFIRMCMYECISPQAFERFSQYF